MNISLPDGLKEFVDTQVDSRGFGTSSEYVRELIRKAVRHHRVGVAVAHAVLRFEPVDDLHVFVVLLRAHQHKPVVHGVAVRLLDGGEVRRGAFDFLGATMLELLRGMQTIS